MTDIQYVGIKNPQDTAKGLAKLMAAPLKDSQKILWLISGGSSLPVAVEVATLSQGSDLRNLSITLVDDVLGVDGQVTNWYKLHELGFRLHGAKMHPILHAGLSLTETGKAFDAYLHEQLQHADFSIGQFGIGEGFHTGGILPRSVAAKENGALAIGYEIDGVQRVTVTPALVAKLDVAFINSMGEKKREMVAHFRSSRTSIFDEPTQALKLAKQTLLYSDVLK